MPTPKLTVALDNFETRAKIGNLRDDVVISNTPPSLEGAKLNMNLFHDDLDTYGYVAPKNWEGTKALAIYRKYA